MNQSSAAAGRGNLLLTANYPSDVGYAWWLMESFWAAIARHFSAAGRRCFLMYPKINAVPRVIEEAPLTLIEHDARDLTPAALRRFEGYVREHDLRGAYLTDYPYYSPLYWRMRRWGVQRIVMHDHKPGERPRPSLPKRLFKSGVHRLGLLSCDHYIGVSRFVRDRCVGNACIPSDRCSFVLNGIRPIALDPALRGYAREQFGIPDDAVLVVTTGRATYYKGIDFLVRVAARVRRQVDAPEVYFLHCGDGPDLREFKLLAQVQGLEDRFLFAGQRNDVSKILQSADIGIQASKGEAFSLSILEYLSAGLPTLVPAVCGNAEAVDEGRTGFLFPAGDEELAAQRLVQLVRDPALRRRMGEAAAADAQARFTIDRAERELVALLDDLL